MVHETHESTGLIPAIEDAFSIAIPEEDAPGFHNVGDLYDYILSHRYGGKREACLSSLVTYRLRRGLMWVLKKERKDIRASTDMAALVPSRRYRTWKKLEKAIGLRLPQLRRPKWVMVAAVLATLATAVAVPRLLGLGMFNGAMLIGIFTAFIAGHCMSWLTSPFAVELQPDCKTFRQLAEATLARNYRSIVDEASAPPNANAVWDALRTVVGEQLGISARNITRETALSRSLVAV